MINKKKLILIYIKHLNLYYFETVYKILNYLYKRIFKNILKILKKYFMTYILLQIYSKYFKIKFRTFRIFLYMYNIMIHILYDDLEIIIKKRTSNMFENNIWMMI